MRIILPIFILALLPALGHAGDDIDLASAHLMTLRDFKPGDTIQFPRAIVLAPKHSSDVLETNFYFSRQEHPSCHIEVPNTDDSLAVGFPDLTWRIAENPYAHGLFSGRRVTLVLEAANSKKRLKMDCDHDVDVQMLEGINFTVTIDPKRDPVHVVPENDPVVPAPVTPADSGTSAQ